MTSILVASDISLTATESNLSVELVNLEKRTVFQCSKCFRCNEPAAERWGVQAKKTLLLGEAGVNVIYTPVSMLYSELFPIHGT